MIERWIRIGCVCAAAALASAAHAATERQDADSAFSRELAEAEATMPDPAHGAALFNTCAQCHGAHRTGVGGAWIPEIAGQYRSVLEKELIDYRHGRRWDLRMEMIAGRHVLKTTQDIVDVAAYASALAPFAQSRTGSGQWLAQGERLYQARCTSCHGRAGEGSMGRAVPRIAGQSYDYLLRQLHDSLEGRRPNMSPVHPQALRHLGMEQLTGLADFLSRFEPGPAAAQTITAAPPGRIAQP